VRDRELIGAQLACPDCGRPIRVVEGKNARLAIEPVGSVEAPSAQTAPASAPRRSGASASGAREAGLSWTLRLRHGAARGVKRLGPGGAVLDRLRDPLVLVWGSAILFALVMLAVAWPRTRADVEGEEGALAGVATEQPRAAAEDERDESADTPPPQRPEPPVDAAEQDERAAAANLAEGSTNDDSAPPPVRPPAVAERPAVPRRLPVAAEVPDVTALLNVMAALDQPIQRFEQAKPVPLRELLLELEEMAAVPIHADPEQIPELAARLERRVTVQLENTTVGEILRAAVKNAGLTYEKKSDGVHLVPEPPPLPGTGT